MSFASSFPAKTIDLGAVGLAYTVEVTDSLKVSEYLRKDVLRSFVDVTVSIDYFRKITSFYRDFVDTEVVSEYLKKDVAKPFVDTSIPIDYFSKSVSKVKSLLDSITHVDYLKKDVLRSFVDRAYGEWLSTQETLKTLVDTVKSLEMVYKETFKTITERVRVRDAPYRVVSIILRDMVFGEHWPTRACAKRMFDRSKMADVITKVSYKLAGYDVRRVHWHRVWYDIIEAQDHNVKVEVAKALLEAMKRLKEKLEA